MLTNSIILAICRRDTLRPLGIQFRPFANSVRDTKDHRRRLRLLQNCLEFAIGNHR